MNRNNFIDKGFVRDVPKRHIFVDIFIIIIKQETAGVTPWSGNFVKSYYPSKLATGKNKKYFYQPPPPLNWYRCVEQEINLDYRK